MQKIHVLVSCKVTSGQLARMNSIDSALVIHGEPGGYAIMPSSEVDHKGIDYPDERPDRDVESLVRQAEAIIATRIPSNLGERAPRLRWLQFTSAGIDHLWKPWLDDGSLIVTSAKSIHALPMAEFCLGGMLFFAKNFRRMLRQQSARRYDKFVTDELHGKTVALVGVGEIGGAIAERAKQFGMRTLGIRRRPARTHPMLDEVVGQDSWPGVLGRADYVVNSLPLTDRTRAIFDAPAFRAMQRSAIFINVGRGRTVVESDLIEALAQKWIAGAVLDVFEREPLASDSKLWAMDNVILSPHIAADTPLYMERFTEIICDNLRRYAAGEPLRNVIDINERY
jgi:phosphoglycerate dehydrogenase-like enzyme